MSVLARELAKIQDRYGELTADLIVAEATPESHPLHCRFTWDDTEAAKKWRRVEAECLIRRVKVDYSTGPEADLRVRAYTSVADEDGRRSYLPTEMALAMNSVQVLAAVRRDFVAFRARWARYCDLDAFLAAQLAAPLEAA